MERPTQCWFRRSFYNSFCTCCPHLPTCLISAACGFLLAWLYVALQIVRTAQGDLSVSSQCFLSLNPVKITRSIRSQYRKTDIYVSDISSRNLRRGHTLLVESIPKHHLLRMIHTLYPIVTVSEALTYLSWFAYNTSHESRVVPEDLTVWHIHFLPILFCLDAYTPQSYVEPLTNIA